jgi:serine/threonine-protein kinase HipA
MALKLVGKDERLRRGDFIALAARAGIRATDAHAVIDDVLRRLPVAIDAVAFPAALPLDGSARAAIARCLDICRARVRGFD